MSARVWVVTGGAAGLGLAVGRRAATQGERVVLVDRDEPAVQAAASAAASAGLDVVAVVTDVSREAEVEACCASILGEHGRVDVLVNNAGLALREGSVAALTPKQWQLSIAVNLTSVYLMSHGLLPGMPRGSSIVNVGTAGTIRTVPGTDAYLAAKGGVVALSKAMAVSLADRAVRVNVVCPGIVLTDEVRRRRDDPRVQAMTRRSGDPLGRDHATPDEFADVVWYLASDQAGFLNGVVLPVDGGATT